MTVALAENRVAARSRPAEYRVERTDIDFFTAAPGLVRIDVTVTNAGERPARAGLVRLQAAPLGAFVPWQDLTSVVVPPLQPRATVTVSAEVSLPQTRALGDFSKVPPRKLLTAVAGDDQPAQPATANPLGSMLRNLLAPPGSQRAGTGLADDVFALLRRPNAHWAGNINVLIGDRAVERHLARALRIYPGRTNLAAFFVGQRPDEYRFELSGTATAWDANLFDFTRVRSLVQTRSQVIPQSRWIKMDGFRVILLAVAPPEDCDSGSLDVHVQQRSSGREAVVEFSLDPTAAGAGCYAV